MPQSQKLEPGSGDSDHVGPLDQIWERRLKTKRPGRPSLSVGILVCPSFSLMSLTGIVESLRHAGDFGDQSRQIDCQWEILGTAKSSVRSSCGIAIATTRDYVNPNDLDYLFVVGGLLEQAEYLPAAHRRYLQAAKAVDVTIVGVCTGIFLLAEERLLAGKTVCVHPYHLQDFALAFPGHKCTTRNDYVVDGRIITVPGGISILSLMAAIIKAHLGPDRASKAVHQLSVTGKRSLSEFERTGLMRQVSVSDPRIQKALVLIENDVKGRLSIPDLAAQLGLSPRHFSRRFAEQVGHSPKAYIQQTRLRYAMWMLSNSSNSITSIAYAAGFSSSSHFCSAFRERFGISPGSVRARHDIGEEQ
ncbi:GlxA family transcriptional regulator [Chachezhania sediminis]|uniref:GlxA family transcriptional regulator n=1 Tax=Chachezhania sediminis TaxID=2599291 RepID=UPI00131BF5EB|nr:helix-turn-helix domain-containing protein [Chachezhania sediminis]